MAAADGMTATSGAGAPGDGRTPDAGRAPAGEGKPSAAQAALAGRFPALARLDAMDDDARTALFSSIHAELQRELNSIK